MYVKKPVVVEAHQWFKNGDHPEDDSGGMKVKYGIDNCEGKVVRYYRNPDVCGEKTCTKCNNTMHEHGWIDTLEGGHTVCPGDYIITGIKGERYPCKPDIFNMTYDALE